MSFGRRSKLIGLLICVIAFCGACGVERAAEPTAQAQPVQTTTTPFDYDAAAPLNAAVTKTKEAPASIEERIEFDSPKGGRVAGLLIRPKGVQKPPVVLFLHGLGGSKSDARLAATLLIPEGVAVLGLDAACHGDRKKEGEEFFSPDLTKTREHIVQTVVDYRRAIDYLDGRQDVDAQRVGLVGASLGGILGALVTAVDKRVKTCLLIVGGGSWREIISKSEHPAAQKLREEIAREGTSPLDEVDPVRWVARISPRPMWMLNGRQDKIVPAAAAKALYEAAREPKKIIWYDDGHMPPMPLVASTLKSWLKECLFSGGQGE